MQCFESKVCVPDPTSSESGPLIVGRGEKYSAASGVEVLVQYKVALDRLGPGCAAAGMIGLQTVPVTVVLVAIVFQNRGVHSGEGSQPRRHRLVPVHQNRIDREVSAEAG